MGGRADCVLLILGMTREKEKDCNLGLMDGWMDGSFLLRCIWHE